MAIGPDIDPVLQLPNSPNAIISYYTGLTIAYTPEALRDVFCNPFLTLNSLELGSGDLINLGFTSDEATTYNGAQICRDGDCISNLSAVEHIYIPIPSKTGSADLSRPGHWNTTISSKNTSTNIISLYNLRIVFENGGARIQIIRSETSFPRNYVNGNTIKRLENRVVNVLDYRGIILSLTATPPPPGP